MTSKKPINVLSIQSFVVHGFVGNKCSMFALQTLGIEVDPLCTVQLSNHTGYPRWRGQVLGAQQISEIFDGLTENSISSGYTHVLTGYCRDPEGLEMIARTVRSLKASNSSLFYLCDPVLGDDGKLYVPSELVPIYRDSMVPMANVVKLNQTEAEVLTGVPIRCMKDAHRAIDALHALGPSTVVISSCYGLAKDSGDSSTIQVIGSSEGRRFMISIPRIRAYFSGTGDLFSALLLAWMAKGDPAWTAVEKTVSTIQSVIARTAEVKSRELLLVQSRHEVEFPPKSSFSLSFL